MNRRFWVIGGVAVAIAALFTLLVPRQQTTSPDHRSDSYAPEGTSALFDYAAALGHPTTRMRTALDPPSRGILFVFSPDQPFTDAEADRLFYWVAAGGTLIYADDVGDRVLDNRFGLERQGSLGPTRFDPTHDEAVVPTGPFFGGVSHLAGGAGAETFLASPVQAPVLERARDRAPIAVEGSVGQGRVIALGDPLELCNHYIGKQDNGRLAADIIGLAPAGGVISFDEYHHGAGGGGNASLMDWATTPVGGPVFWALVVGYLGFLLRGRAFGPRVPVRVRTVRSSAEHAGAVGRLLSRAGARRLTLGVLTDATRRALGERSGLGRNAPPDRVSQVLRQRAPALADRLQRAEELTHVAGSEKALLNAARELHSLAYPSAEHGRS